MSEQPKPHWMTEAGVAARQQEKESSRIERMVGAIHAAQAHEYSAADRRFYDWWYSHMKADQMQPPLHEVSQSTARFIWDAESNRADLLQEDIDCLHKCLDDKGVPRADAGGSVFSLWGRVQALLEAKGPSHG